MAYNKQYPKPGDDQIEWNTKQEDRIEKGINDAITQATNIKVLSPKKLSGNVLTINFDKEWYESSVVSVFVRHPTGGHWVSGVPIKTVTQNRDRTNCVVNVDGFYADQEVIVTIAK